jgi:predicted RecA/RadA family phage recombinase
MRNFIQPGSMITVPAPAGGVVSGQGVQIGALFGVAATTQAAGDDVALALTGVYELPKDGTAGVGFSVGDPVEWNAAFDRAEPLDGGQRIGVAVTDAGPSAAVVRVRLDG